MALDAPVTNYADELAPEGGDNGSMVASAEKLRGYVIDKNSGVPVAGVVVLAIAEFDDGREAPIGMLAADAAGYVSFDLRRVTFDAPPTQVHIKPAGAEGSRITIPYGGTSRLASPSSSQYERSRAPIVGGRMAARLPSCVPTCRPSRALIRSTGSSRPPRSPPAGRSHWTHGSCRVLVPSEDRKFPARTHHFTQVVRRTLTLEAGNEASTAVFTSPLTETEDAVSGSALYQMVPPPPPGAPSTVDEIAVDTSKGVELGQVLRFRQTWLPLGHSLGKIAYSLPLAPCESVNIAVIDWSRSDLAVRNDAAKSTENLVHSQRRDRTIEEIIDTALSESQGGSSFQLGLGLAGQGSLGSFSAGGAAGIGYGSAQSWGKRELTGSSLQELHDSIVQASGFVRELHSTVVVQASQQEHNYVETRTVTNHNHCHALTVQYHEVLQHLRIDTQYLDRRWALLIPYKLLDFDWRTALRHRTALETALLDPSLASCFDATVRVHYCQAAYPKPADNEGKGNGAGTHPATPVHPTITRYEPL